jgi:DNA-binding SARP family transcriptional activator
VADGRYQDAARWLSEALQLHLALGRTHRTAAVIHYCAHLVFRLGYPAQATTLLVAGLRAAGIESNDFSYIGNGDDIALLACSQAAQAALDPAAYALAAADGAALTLEEAADLALSAVFLPERPLAAEAPAALRIFLFGQLRVERDGRALTEDDWIYTKTKDVLLFLLLVDSATKAEIGAAIWPDASAKQLKHNFHIAIYHLRRALGRTDWISFSKGRYAFNRSAGAWVDVAAFERAVEQAASDPIQRAHHLRTAAALYTGDLACGNLEGDMPLIRREWLHQQGLQVMLALGALHEERSQPAEAAAAYRRALALDRYSEAAHRGLLRSLARQGETSAALAHYDQLVELLADELDVAPISETAALAAQIKRGEAI